MIKVYIDRLFKELEEDLNEYAEMGIVPIKRLNGALQSMRSCLLKLRAHITDHPFQNTAEEIEFFKKEKPRFVAEQLYAIDLTIIQTSRPFYDREVIRSFFEQELRTIRRFLKKYSFLYQYYQLDSTDMDALFFVRGAYPKDILVPDSADLDPQFSAACDHAWARFMAYERLQMYLLEELLSLDNPVVVRLKEDSNTVELKWTGETINLVELGYGMWLTGQINNGNASITEIIEWLEVHFRVKIGKAHRRWQSISRRKRIGSFKYIDEVKAALVKRLEEEWGR